MQLQKLSIGPHVEGVIRVATNVTGDAQAGRKIEFKGELEVLARTHAQTAAEGEQVPKLAPHPIAEGLMQHEANQTAGKLVEIPVTMFFNKASNAIAAKYQAYDNSTNQPVCTGDGIKATRFSMSPEGAVLAQGVPCPGAEVCDYANSGKATCRRQVAVSVQIEGQENTLNVFEVRSSSYNSYKALRGQLALIEHRFGGLRHVPLKLKLWRASNRASEFEPFDLLELALNAADDADAMAKATTARTAAEKLGLIDAPDQVFEALRADAEFNQAADDFTLVEDFYNPIAGNGASRRSGTSAVVAATLGKGSSAGQGLASDMIRGTLQAAMAAVPPAVETDMA